MYIYIIVNNFKNPWTTRKHHSVPFPRRRRRRVGAAVSLQDPGEQPGGRGF